MAPSSIHNSLLRIDNTAGVPPPPFEQPNAKMDFWVLEFPSSHGDDVASWCARAVEFLESHSQLLSQLRGTGKRLTLFLEPGASERALRLEPLFLKALADHEIAIEVYNSGS